MHRPQFHQKAELMSDLSVEALKILIFTGIPAGHCQILLKGKAFCY